MPLFKSSFKKPDQIISLETIVNEGWLYDIYSVSVTLILDFNTSNRPISLVLHMVIFGGKSS